MPSRCRTFPIPLVPTDRGIWGRQIWPTRARIDAVMHDGKLYLSLNDAIALALENNLDIAIARYTLNIADTDVLRARAGATILGTPLGTVLNTPGGGIGGIGPEYWCIHRRYESGRRRHRRRHQRLGQFYLGEALAGDQQLRSGHHRDAPGRSFQPAGHQHFSGSGTRVQPGAEHRHGRLCLQSGFSVGNQSFHWFQQYSMRPPTAFSPA